MAHYKIVEEISGGNFGHTYKAIDTAFPEDRYCVVKHLIPYDQDSETLKIAKRLFKSEAIVLSR